MTTVTNLTSGGNGFYDDDLTVIAAATLGSHSSTSFVLTGSGFSVTLYGTGLTYSGGHVSGGTITSLSIVNTTGVGMPSQSWSGFSLSAAAVWNAVTAHDSAAANALFFGGNDTFTGTGTSFTFSGFGGDDTFNVTLPAAGPFMPSLDGGDGYDTLNLTGDVPYLSRDYGAYPLTTWMSNIERLNLGAGHTYKLTTYYSDSVVAPGATLTVDASALSGSNFLNFDGSSETDGAFVLIGGAGNDVLRGGAGNDIIDGGGGSDTIDVRGAGDGMVLDLRLTTAQTLAGLGKDTIRNVENIFGSGTLIGNDAANIFIVYGSATSIDGGAGSDTLDCSWLYSAHVDLSQTGPQRIDPNSSLTTTLTSIENVIGTGLNDTFIGNAADNTFDGRGGTDYVSLADSTTAVTIDMRGANPVVTGATGIGNDTYISIEGFVGTNYDDTFIMGSNASYATLDGGSGNDTVDFSHCTTGVGIDLSRVAFLSIENVIGSAYDDQLIGPFGVGNYTIDGGAGNDRILMSRGANVVEGGSGDDIIFMDGDWMPDVVDGGTGNDTVYYFSDDSYALDTFSATTMTNVETMLLDHIQTRIKFDDGNVAAGATLTIRFRDDSNTWITDMAVSVDGSAETDGRFDITTLDGVDTLIGGAGADVLRSGGGDDMLSGLGGNDTLDGGAGSDTAVFSGNRSASTITLNADGSVTVVGPDGTDTLTNIEYVKFADQTISTDRTAPTLTSTYPADDATDISPFGGLSMTFSEAVKAGTGNIVLCRADGTVALTFAATDSSHLLFSGSRVTILPPAGLDSLTSYYVTVDPGAVTDLSGNPFAGITSPTAFNFKTAYIPDTTPPQMSSSTPTNYSANVALNSDIVLTFSESVKAGTGNITIIDAQTSATLATCAITDASQVTFSGNTVTLNPADNLPGGRSLVVAFDNHAISDLSGNYFSGSLTFMTVPNTVTGSSGDDSLVGTAYNDALYGLGGNDTIVSGTGTDFVDGGDGIDTVSYADRTGPVCVQLGSNTASDLISSGNVDTLVSIENAIGGGGNDLLYGNAAANVLSGGAGSDDLEGYGGNDTLIGGAGSNMLYGGDGTDTAGYALRPGDYYVTVKSGGSYIVYGPGQTDQLFNVEQASFAATGQTLSMTDFLAQSFNPLNYIASYADLIGAFGDNAQAGVQHYFNNGLAEDRTITFNPLNYIASHGDLIGAFGDNQLAGVEHYIKNGFAEGRKVTFNPLNYIASYGDLIGAFADDQTAATEHYINNGYGEGRKASFDPLAYLCSYGDLIGAFGDNQTWAAEHYIKNGFAEGRRVSFDPLAYICSYGDLIGAFGDNKTAAEEHYIKNGFAEGRKVTFNGLNYIASYGDLIQAFGEDVTAAEEHYIKNGFSEGRKVTFDPVAYLINNTDLGSCGFTAANVTEHYVKNGFGENRTADGAFGSEQTGHDLTVGGSVSDTIGTAGDKDWFDVKLSAGQTYTFTLSGADGAGGTLADPFLGLYDAHGLLVSSNNDATGHDSKITITAAATGAFYLVASANDAGTGTYKLFGATGG